jgi:hypothetical protein
MNAMATPQECDHSIAALNLNAFSRLKIFREIFLFVGIRRQVYFFEARSTLVFFTDIVSSIHPGTGISFAQRWVNFVFNVSFWNFSNQPIREITLNGEEREVNGQFTKSIALNVEVKENSSSI